MAECAYCGSTILFGGKKEGNLKFCNQSCAENGYVLLVAEQVPDNIVRDHVQQVHSGLCPKCQGSGPIDVHTSHTVWSALLVTSWNSNPQICCRSCGLQHQLRGLGFSLLLGWWGFPWGIIMTPVQIVRNLSGMVSGPDPLQPSEKLHQQVRLALAANAVEQYQKASIQI